MLDVGDGNFVYWEVCGTSDGQAALVVHGGPGSGCRPGMRRFFDPARYRVVLFDQRGCGRSTPHASDPATDMRHNTTAHLIADMELLREHLGIDRWLLYGASWGSTLVLAYAEQHPQRVSGIVICSVTTTRRCEIDWLYRGAGRFFPEQWERFLAGAPGTPRDGDIVGAYASLAEHPDAAVLHALLRERRVASGRGAAAGRPPPGRDSRRPDPRRLDIGGPLDTAWDLARAWPGAHLVVVEDAGHLGSRTTRDHVLHALDKFAAG
jgi:proline iminopeptidase